MSRFHKTLLAAAAAVLGCASAQATVATTSVLSTYYFNADCSDCAAAANSAGYGVLGTLVLQDYTAGSAIDASNFVSFAYSGSNLAPAFMVDANTVLTVLSGSIPGTLPAAAEFIIEWGDRLGFHAHADGSFYVCAPGSSTYYGNDCTAMWNNDQGTGTFSTTQTVVLGPTGGTVPEPASALLVGAALLAASARRRRAG